MNMPGFTAEASAFRDKRAMIVGIGSFDHR
jgi:hypothetical protein